MPLNFDDGQSAYDNGTSAWDDSAQFPQAAPIGTQADFLARLKALVPRSWLPFQSSPNFDATMQGPAYVLALNHALVMYAWLQMRIKTAVDGFLDVVSNDYFGIGLPRMAQEGDSSFRGRILANLFVKGPTRRDMIDVLTLITGRPPAIFEPNNAADSGGYDGGAFFDCMGGWGDAMPYQALVTVLRPAANDVSLGEYDSTREWLDGGGYYSDAQAAGVSDQAIAAAVESTRPLGTIVWLRVADNPVTP